jgi:endonuclease YncB( thermonuclease family)
LASLTLGAPSFATAAPAEREAVHVLAVIDGDSIRARLGANRIERIRLVGLDAPELGEHARCPAEAHLAERARARLVALLASGSVEMQQHGRDRYGRVLALVTVDGADVAATMIGEGLARPYAGGRRLSWCVG